MDAKRLAPIGLAGALLGACRAEPAPARDAAPRDAAAALVDAAPPRFAQVCDAGATRACDALAAAWQAGADATCAADGTRWDTAACTPVDTGGTARTSEVVYPAQRDPARWGDARCSYEGDFVFEVALAPTPTNVWQIVLEGGGQCSTDADCHDRDLWKVAPYRSPTPDAPFVPFEPDGTIASLGLGEYTTPGIDDVANIVKANYCSSDGWTGTNLTGTTITYDDPRTGQPVTRPWVFAGRPSVRAMLELLRERYGLDDSRPDLQIHLRGQSAGGIGVANNAWVLAEMLPRAAAAHRVLVSSWNGFIPPEWDPTQYPFEHVDDFWYGDAPGVTGRQAMTTLAAVWGAELMPSCAAHEADAADCLSVGVLYPYITNEPDETPAGLGVPMLVYQNRQDLVLASNIGMKPLAANSPPDQLTVRTAWRGLLDDLFGLLPGPNAGRMAWVFAPDDPQRLIAGVGLEPGVHPPLDYFLDPPGDDTRSLQAMTARFWSYRGRADWREHGEITTFACNWVTRADSPEARDCVP